MSLHTQYDKCCVEIRCQRGMAYMACFIASVNATWRKDVFLENSSRVKSKTSWLAGHPPDRLCHAKYPMSCNAQWRRLELCMEQVEIFEILGECVANGSTKKGVAPKRKLTELVYLDLYKRGFMVDTN